MARTTQATDNEDQLQDLVNTGEILLTNSSNNLDGGETEDDDTDDRAQASGDQDQLERSDSAEGRSDTGSRKSE